MQDQHQDKIRDALASARALIVKPERWCQGATAQTESGVPTDPCDPSAATWCALGAILRTRADQDLEPRVFRGLYNALHELFCTSISYYNDTHTHTEVLAAFDAAIASL